MKASLLFVTMALLGAGCLTAANDAIDPAATELTGLVSTAGVLHGVDGALVEAPATFVAALGGAYATGASASEPTIGITSDGAVFMTGSVPNPTCGVSPEGCPAIPYAGFARGPTIMRSMDKGQTWEDVFPKLPTGDSYKLRSWDPYVYVDRDTDRVFMDDIYPLGCGFMSFSDDRGESWMHDPLACGNPHVNDHQTVVTAKPRTLPTTIYPNLVYRCVNNVAYAACAISITGGQTFLPQIPIAQTMVGGECSAITGHLESDFEGRVYLGLPCGDGAGVLMTEDDGQSWTLGMVSDLPLDGHDVDLATDEAGNVYALFVSEGMPYYSYSTDHGASWSPAVMVAAPGVTLTKFNAIAAGAPGKVAFAYVGTTIADAKSLPPAECGALPALPCTDPEEWASATWNAYVGVMTDALSAAPVIQTVTANDPSDPLARGACGDRCHGMTDFIDVQIDVEGRPWASFVDVCVAECLTDASVLFDGNMGLAATLRQGPALRGDVADLFALAPPPVAS